MSANLMVLLMLGVEGDGGGSKEKEPVTRSQMRETSAEAGTAPHVTAGEELTITPQTLGADGSMTTVFERREGTRVSSKGIHQGPLYRTCGRVLIRFGFPLWDKLGVRILVSWNPYPKGIPTTWDTPNRGAQSESVTKKTGRLTSPTRPIRDVNLSKQSQLCQQGNEAWTSEDVYH